MVAAAIGAEGGAGAELGITSKAMIHSSATIPTMMPGIFSFETSDFLAGACSGSWVA
jgi:hypothetical protein